VPHQALYRRWRAQTFAEIVGQEAVVETLRNSVRADRVSHAVLFVGPRGTGKTSLARILAKAVNCTNLQDGDACDACSSCVSIREGTTLDMIEIDAASNRGIDAVRELRERLPYPPGQLRRKVYILDEAHQITKDAWNALLKSLEEPPDFVIFMFASTEPSLFPPAILSRLQRFDVRRLSVPEIEGKLTRILAADGREAEPAAIHLIARLAAGGMRDAESMLDQLLSAAPERIDEAHVRDLLGLADADIVEAFVDHLVRGDGPAGVALLDALEERGRDIRALLDQAVETIRSEMIAGLADPAAAPHDPSALAAAGRRLAAIDPNRPGIGGLRFQLELAMFSAAPGDATDRPTAQAAAPIQRPSKPAAAPPSDAVDPTEDGPQAESERTPIQDTATPAATRPPVAGTPQAAGEPDQPEAPTPAAGRSSAAAPRMPSVSTPTSDRSGTVDPGTPPAQTPELPIAASPALSSGARPTVATEVEPGSDLARLRDGWSEVVASVGPSTRAVISECRPMGVDGNIVTLGFPESKGFLKDVAERKRPELETAFGRFFGRAVSVRSVATNLELPPAASDDLVAEARRIFAEELADVGEVR
ncbi:MAG: DNA polymerase III subunit gamma/tau, partial [Chloroflexota bacterium]